MTLLRRTLKVQAALWAAFGLACLIAPGSVHEMLTGIGSSSGDDAIVRVLGLAGVILAMTMVLVAQHPSETWWWAWAFVLLEAGVATVSILQAVTGQEYTPTTPWWILGAVSTAFAILDLVALARSEQAKPFA